MGEMGMGGRKQPAVVVEHEPTHRRGRVDRRDALRRERVESGEREVDRGAPSEAVAVEGRASASLLVHVDKVGAHALAPRRAALLLREQEGAQRREHGHWVVGGRRRRRDRDVDARPGAYVAGAHPAVRHVENLRGAVAERRGAEGVVRVHLAVRRQVEVEEVEVDMLELKAYNSLVRTRSRTCLKA